MRSTSHLPLFHHTELLPLDMVLLIASLCISFPYVSTFGPLRGFYPISLFHTKRNWCLRVVLLLLWRITLAAKTRGWRTYHHAQGLLLHQRSLVVHVATLYRPRMMVWVGRHHVGHRMEAWICIVLLLRSTL